MSFVQTVLTDVVAVGGGATDVQIVAARADVHIRIVHLTLSFTGTIAVDSSFILENSAPTTLALYRFNAGRLAPLIVGDGHGAIIVNPIINTVIRADNAGQISAFTVNVAWVYLPVP